MDGAAHTNSLVPPRSIVIPILIEPSFVALGANHVAVGMHNHVMYYRIKVGRGLEKRIYILNRHFLFEFLV